MCLAFVCVLMSSFCVFVQVPHPYKSADQYEATLQHATGPEWNTASMHARLIAPKVMPISKQTTHRSHSFYVAIRMPTCLHRCLYARSEEGAILI